MAGETDKQVSESRAERDECQKAMPGGGKQPPEGGPPGREPLAAKLEDLFTYHAPTADQIPKYQELRSLARAFAEGICRCVPTGADQAAAVRLVREAVMTANAGIATNGRA